MIEVFYNSFVEFLTIFPVLAFSVVVPEFVSRYVHAKKIETHLKKSKKGILIPTGIGIFAPGPLIAYLPSLFMLRKKGLPLSYVVAFITAHTFMGPLRVFIEIFYFDIYFFIVRTTLAFIMSFSIGLIFRALEKKKFFAR